MKTLSKCYTILIFVLLYAPIAVMILFSFNSSSSTSVFSGFSLHWYEELFKDSATMNALKNTLLISVTAALAATVLGTLATVGIRSLRKRYVRNMVQSVTNIPMMNPDIVTGISMMLLFVFAASILHSKNVLGFHTLLLAHITFNLPYVILSVMPKFRQMDQSLPEAALDLGCTPIQAFFKVELPAIMPGIITAFITAFTLSLDDFVVSYFTTGSSFETLPIRIFSMTKKRVTPDMYALSTLIFIAILALLLLYNFTGTREEREKNRALRAARKQAKEAREAAKKAQAADSKTSKS